MSLKMVFVTEGAETVDTFYALSFFGVCSKRSSAFENCITISTFGRFTFSFRMSYKVKYILTDFMTCLTLELHIAVVCKSERTPIYSLVESGF